MGLFSRAKAVLARLGKNVWWFLYTRTKFCRADIICFSARAVVCDWVGGGGGGGVVFDRAFRFHHFSFVRPITTKTKADIKISLSFLFSK